MTLDLYQRLVEKIENQLVGIGDTLNEHRLHAELDKRPFIRLFNESWTDHLWHMSVIRSIFLYLDRTIQQVPGKKGIWEVGLELFRRHVWDRSRTRNSTIRACLDEFNRNRSNSELQDFSDLKIIIGMFKELGLYEVHVETPLTESTRSFYSTESSAQIESLSVSEYLKYCEKRLGEESDRINLYLNGSSNRVLILTVEKEILVNHAQKIIEKGFANLVNQNLFSDLRRLFALFDRVSALDLVKSAFAFYVKLKGLELLDKFSKEEDDEVGGMIRLITALLDFRRKMTSILIDGFDLKQNTPIAPNLPSTGKKLDESTMNLSERFNNALMDSFEYFINTRQSLVAESLAKYADQCLRGRLKDISDSEIRDVLDQVIAVFRFIQGKDVFEAYYNRDLAKRLLLDKSADMDLEKEMLSKLKIECGAGFTSKLEGMFKDMELSKDLNKTFRNKARNRIFNLPEFSVSVITQSFWPSYTPLDIILPQQLMKCQTVFHEYYMSTFNGRKLIWQHNLGQCTLNANYNNGCGTKEFQLSLLQAVVLLCFNDTNTLSADQISKRTNITGIDLTLTLQSLSLAKYRVLGKNPKTKEVLGADQFTYNSRFDSKLKKLKFNSIQYKETKKEHEDTERTIVADRIGVLDAAIVRIMKTSKKCTYAQLMQQVFAICKFPIAAKDFKERIDSLIDREFVSRDSSDMNMYHYVA